MLTFGLSGMNGDVFTDFHLRRKRNHNVDSEASTSGLPSGLPSGLSSGFTSGLPRDQTKFEQTSPTNLNMEMKPSPSMYYQ